MNEKKYPVMLTRNEIEAITNAMDTYIALRMKNHYAANDLNSIMRLNLELKYGIVEIDESESFDKVVDKGILKWMKRKIIII